jgi:hypothetical protein
MNTTNSTVAQRTNRRAEVIAAILDAEIAPYMLGALDAERGEPCNPNYYYTRDGMIAEYREGYEVAANELAQRAGMVA